MKAADLPTYYNICEILEHNLEHRGDKIARFYLHDAQGYAQVSHKYCSMSGGLPLSSCSLSVIG